MTLTPRQNKVLIFLRAHMADHGIAPSYREISGATGIRSTSNVAYIIDTLAWQKYLRRIPDRARNIELLQTEDYHLPSCNCDRCAHGRYLSRLNLVQALQVTPPIALVPKLAGLRPLGHLTRLDWAYRDNSRVRRKPLLSCTKPADNPFHPNLRGAV